MEITILEFIPDRKNARIGYVDFSVVHSPEKEETFRGVGYFEKGDKRWLSFAAVERNGKWLPRYSRKPSLQEVFNSVLEKLKTYVITEKHIENKISSASPGDLFCV